MRLWLMLEQVLGHIDVDAISVMHTLGWFDAPKTVVGPLLCDMSAEMRL